MLADDVTVYIENPKELTKKILELVSNNSKIITKVLEKMLLEIWAQVNTQKLIAFLYNRNKQGEFENNIYISSPQRQNT